MSIVGNQEGHTGCEVGAGHTSSLPIPVLFPAEGRHDPEHVKGAWPPRPGAFEEWLSQSPGAVIYGRSAGFTRFAQLTKMD